MSTRERYIVINTPGRVTPDTHCITCCIRAALNLECIVPHAPTSALVGHGFNPPTLFQVLAKKQRKTLTVAAGLQLCEMHHVHPLPNICVVVVPWKVRFRLAECLGVVLNLWHRWAKLRLDWL